MSVTLVKYGLSKELISQTSFLTIKIHSYLCARKIVGQLDKTFKLVV